jgi:hypothetical protein
MAKAPRKRSTSSPSTADRTPPSRKLVYRLGELSPAEQEKVKGLAEASKVSAEEREKLQQEEALEAEGRKVIDRALVIRDGLVPPPAKQLPAMQPKDVPRKVWLAACAVYALVCEGDKSNIELRLEKVRERTGNKNLSRTTLYEARKWLKAKGFIAR